MAWIYTHIHFILIWRPISVLLRIWSVPVLREHVYLWCSSGIWFRRYAFTQAVHSRVIINITEIFWHPSTISGWITIIMIVIVLLLFLSTDLNLITVTHILLMSLWLLLIASWKLLLMIVLIELYWLGYWKLSLVLHLIVVIIIEL